MESIGQFTHRDALPDFRNLGVVARILVAVNAVALAVHLFDEGDWLRGTEAFIANASVFAPALLATLIALYVGSPLLARAPYAGGCAAVVVCVAGIAAAAPLAAAAVLGEDGSAGTRAGVATRAAVYAALIASVLLGYLRLRAKAYSPALAEARLQALQARIRPHFLFNSLNAVLSLIRREPRRAEAALEDLADLFRTLMSDGRSFVRLADELALLERYANLEKLRLGERLRISWDIDAAPSDALLPPLILQPLLENAVYHGVEPASTIGDVLVAAERRGDRVHVRIENPYLEEHHRRAGNRMALENVRERLALFFDAEARIETGIDRGRYCLHLDLPYRPESGSGAAPGRAAAK